MSSRKCFQILSDCLSPLLCLLVLLTGCASPTPNKPTGRPIAAAKSVTLPPQASVTPSQTASSTRSPLPPSTTPQPSAMPGPELCSPLDDFTLQTLPKILTQPYKNPPPGNESLHHGIDFSFYSYGNLKTMTGLKIFSVLSGTVAGITLNKYPYGNMVIIETGLEVLPPALISQLQAPTPAPTLPYTGPLTCTQYPQNPTWDPSKRSLYLLYAHMKDAPIVKIGDRVGCGQQLGVVGSTGDSSNDHLHFEANIGPSGARFNSMGHYSAGMTDEERANYCIWRVSNLFQLFDPMKLLSLQSR